MSEETDRTPEQDTPEAHWKRFEAATRQLFNTPKKPKQTEPKPEETHEKKQTN